MLEFWIKVEPGVAVTVKWVSRLFKGPNGARTIASKTATCNGSWWCWWLLSWLIKKEKITWFWTFSSLPSKKGISAPAQFYHFPSSDPSREVSFVWRHLKWNNQWMGDGWGANFQHTEVRFVLRGDIFPSLDQVVRVLVKMGHIYVGIRGK